MKNQMLSSIFLSAMLVLSSNSSAQTPPVAPAVTEKVVAKGFADSPAFEKVRNITNNSMGILVMSTIGTIYSKTLADGAAEQEEEAKKNVEKIDKLIATFKDSYANFCPSGRESLTEPKCYCYLESGKQNPDRSKSQTCVALWAKDTYRLSALAGSYNGLSKFVDAKGCVALNGQFDENCKCKKFIDAKGENACKKTTNINIPSALGSGFASGVGLQQVTAFSNNSANGNPRLDIMSASELNARAINAKKMTDQILSKLAPTLPANVASILKVDEKNVDRLAAAAIGEKGIEAAMNSASSATGVLASRETDPATDSLIKAAAKKAGLVETTGSGRGLAFKQANAKDGLNFNFMADAGAAGASQTQNFPETQKNYKIQGDISKQTDTSIFEIISNRYIQSGLKRLFEE